jgi:hypothetical protein
MPDAQTMSLAPPAPVNVLRRAAATKAARPAAKPRQAVRKPAASAKKVTPGKPALAPLARKLEAQWAAALAAHQERVRRDFATLHKALAGKPRGAAKLGRILAQKPRATGRLKDVRRAERALKDALDRLKA